jgi:hypothetical protein
MPYPTPGHVPDDEVRAYGGPLPAGPPPSKGRPPRALGALLVLFVLVFCGMGAAIIIAVENANDAPPRAVQLEQVDDPDRPGCE